MYRLIKASDSAVEKELYDKLKKLNINIYNDGIGDNTEDTKVYYLDIDSIKLNNPVEICKEIEKWFIQTEVENSLFIINVNKEETLSNIIFQFINVLISKEVRGGLRPAIVTTRIEDVGMPNYARARFGYAEFFSASTIENIKKVNRLLENGIVMNSVYSI